MEVKGTRLWPPKGGQPRRACQSKRQRGCWMLNCSLRDRPSGRQIAPTALWCYMRCSVTLQTKGGKKQSEWSTKAADRSYQSWTLRQMYLPSSWWAPKLARRKSSLCTLKCTNSGDYQGLHPENLSWWRRWCLPSKTTKGRNKRGHQKWQWGPSQQMPNPKGAEPLGGGGGRLWWKEVWLMWGRPTRRLWPGQQPWKRR